MASNKDESGENNKDESGENKGVVYRYVGRGAYVMGVPTRDLTEEELQALDVLDRKTAKLLYKRVEVTNGSNKS